MTMRHEFVDYAPEKLEDGVLYVSVRLASAVHKCACGCGNEVATPFAPDGWELRFDGRSVSLHPSIGNGALPCRSHYWIRNGRVRWVDEWSKQDRRSGDISHDDRRRPLRVPVTSKGDEPRAPRRASLWTRLRARFWRDPE
jgi:hypothetical protein